ncbi:MAG TPA: DNA translocase FtsK [Anaerolineaceae bacterium]|nr:DNA translocase FtsK [Anaerolineaceae bacterium]HQP08488.1 DNA translocase FtsK [Anaerolineaceae bacterium]
MSSSTDNRRRRTGANTESQPEIRQSSLPRWLESLAGFSLRFDRFLRDIIGLALITGAVLLLFGLLNVSQGSIITPWVNFIRHWLGWGAYGFITLLALGGVMALWRGSRRKTMLTLSQVLALEGILFTLTALLSLFNGHLLDRAESGLDGGYIGWGLAEIFNRILPAPFSTILLLILLTVLVIIGFRLPALIARMLDKFLLTEQDLQAEGIDLQDGMIEPLEALTPPNVETAGTKASLIISKTTGVAAAQDGRLPPLNILMQEKSSKPDEENIHHIASGIERTLLEFGIPARVVGYRTGPTITQYAVEPGYTEKPGPDGEIVRQKVRVSQIANLQRDLALSLSAERIRIEAPVPGQSFIGVEVPNERISIVRLRSILESDAFQQVGSPLSVAMGKNVSGQPIVSDLGRMPHLLIAGTTGSGKSVFIQSLAVCLAMNNTPSDLRMAMLDPKMVELARFNGLPHLLGKVETQVERMLGVLQWAVEEMGRRYRLLEALHSRDLESYNRKMQRKNLETLPRIVLIIDELADLMMSAPDQTEPAVVRLAQMARATGIHLVVATQRPSTDVVTGLIKANFPTRVSFTVASSVDSRVILDANGAETLMGRGDMLFLNPELGTLLRCQGVMVTDHEIERVVNFWKEMQKGEEPEPSPWEELIQAQGEAPDDELLQKAVDVVRKSQRASASLLQRRLRVGYPRAASLIDKLEEMGVIGPAVAGGKEREVFYSADDETDPLADMDSGDDGEEGEQD